MDQLTLFAEEHLANHSQLPDLEKELKALTDSSCLPLVQFLKSISPDGWYGKMSLVSCQVTEGKILAPFSECWGNSGMGSPTGFLTLNISELLKGADECLLSDTLEIGNVEPRYYLSQKACRDLAESQKERQGTTRDTENSIGNCSWYLGNAEGGNLDKPNLTTQNTGGAGISNQTNLVGQKMGTITSRMFNALGARDVEEGALLAEGYQVRRLTPTECERLQFEDGHTKIPYRNKSVDECPDGPRYKALVIQWQYRLCNGSVRE